MPMIKGSEGDKLTLALNAMLSYLTLLRQHLDRAFGKVRSSPGE